MCTYVDSRVHRISAILKRPLVRNSGVCCTYRFEDRPNVCDSSGFTNGLTRVCVKCQGSMRCRCHTHALCPQWRAARPEGLCTSAFMFSMCDPVPDLCFSFCSWGPSHSFVEILLYIRLYLACPIKCRYVVNEENTGEVHARAPEHGHNTSVCRIFVVTAFNQTYTRHQTRLSAPFLSPTAPRTCTQTSGIIVSHTRVTSQ